ncbi:hypothetical protein BAE44_0018408, partial [Dichanthelium oligosanthes]
LDDPSLDINPMYIFSDNRFNGIIDLESLGTFKELVSWQISSEHARDLYQEFHSRYCDIFTRCEFVGGIDSVLGVDCQNLGKAHWKYMRSWPAVLGYIVSIINTFHVQLKQNHPADGFIHEDLLETAKKPLTRLFTVASVVPMRNVFHTESISRDAERLLDKLKDSAREIVKEAKFLMQTYSSHIAVQDGGGITSLTRYLMRYIRLLVKHRSSLDTILGHGNTDDLLAVEGMDSTAQLIFGFIADLDTVLEKQSKLFSSKEVQCLFLMNTHFTLQEVKQSDVPVNFRIQVDWKAPVLCQGIYEGLPICIMGTMGGTVHASILKDNIVKGYRDEQRDQAHQALEGYKEICTRAEIQAETLMTENDNVSAGLLGLIAEHKITTLIIIGIGKSWVNRSRRNLAAALKRGADPSCNILFMHKGRLISASPYDGSIFAFETNRTPSSISSRRLSLSCSSNSSPSPFIWDSRSTPSSILWDSRSTPDSLDPSQLDDPSLEIAGSIFDDSRLIGILGHEAINTFRELTGYLNLVRDSHELHQAFQSKYSEIVSRCQFIGGIDSVLGADSDNCGEEYWKTIKAWPAAFEHIVRVLNTVLELLKQNSFKYNGLTPDKILIAAEELIKRFLDVAFAVTEVRKSPEKLFCTLYMCTAIVDSTPSLRKLFLGDLVSRANRVLTALNDYAKGILRDFKELIQNYSSQKVAQDGSILLITGYVMKYIRLLIHHAGSLDTILGYGQNSDLFFSKGNNDLLLFEGISLTGHLVCGLLGDLNKVIKEKSWLYASSEGLRCLFLMNNAHFIIQEVEHSDIQLIVGAEWLKQRRDDFDKCMRDYMSSTWERVTSHLTIAASPPPKRLRPGILGMFHTNARPWHNFDAAFKETCNSHMHWKVPCPVLRSKLRENISEHVIQAYKAYLEMRRHPSTDTATTLKSKVSQLFEG